MRKEKGRKEGKKGRKIEEMNEGMYVQYLFEGLQRIGREEKRREEGGNSINSFPLPLYHSCCYTISSTVSPLE